MDDSNLTKKVYIKMLNTFRCCDLRALLKGFGRTTYKKKEELRNCALKCLTKKGFKSKIWQIYQFINTEGSPRLYLNDLTRVTDRIEFKDVSLNNDFKHLFTDFPYPIKFKKLPFYDDISEVIKPTILFKNEERIEFVLSSKQVDLVTGNISSSNNKIKYGFQVRICHLENASLNEVTDDYPPGLKFSFNDRLSSLSSIYNPVSNKPIDFTNFIYFITDIKNTMTVKRIPDGKSYVLKMCVVKKYSIDNLVEKLTVKKCRNIETSKDDIRKQFSESDPDLATKVYRFSLVCPLTKTKMKIPAKFIDCNHLECFDVYTFLKMNERLSEWKCPICCKSYSYDDLQIDAFFWKIISSSKLKTNSTDIDLLFNGTWNVCENTKNSNITDLINNTHDNS